MWQRIEDAFTPNSEEFKRTARELAKVKTEQEGRLRDGDSGQSTMLAQRRSRWRRPAAMAAAASMTLALIGWTGAKVIWPASQPDRYGQHFDEAEQHATNSNSAQGDWEAGTGYMSSGLESCVDVLAHISCESNAAGHAASEALDRFANATIKARLTDDRSIRVIALEALDEPDEAKRLHAVAQMEAFIGAAERVIERFDASTKLRAQSRDIMLSHVDEYRQQALAGTLETKLPPREAGQRMRPAKQIPIAIPEEFLTPKTNR